MPIDPRIALGYQPPQIESPVNMMRQMQVLQSGQQENQLRQAQMENYQAEAARRNALLPHEIAFTQAKATAEDATRKKVEREIAVAELDRNMERVALVNDQPAWAQWRESVVAKDPNYAAYIPEAFSPENKNAALTTAKMVRDQLSAPLHFADTGNRAAVGFNPRTGQQVSPGVAKTLSPDAAAARADRAPTVTTIRDPNDPNRNLQIDARTYRGGSVGEAGVLGESSKPTETAKLDARELAKREAAYPQATTSVKSVESNTDALIAKLKTLRDHSGLSGMTGLIAGRTPNLTSDAREAQALYKQIMATGQFGVLQSLRESSKTGGALGNVSDTEGKALRDAFGALDTTQSTASFQKGVDAAIADLERTKRVVREGYDATYEYKSNASNGGKPTPPAAAASGWGEAKVK